ncbi:MAG: adenylate/guanylate cyclase domain-containing protein [Nitrospirae bacterium]|nr:adenylate/guanylate cyclase domain-containing protein [Nitrospirota bacterium]
MKKRLFLYLVPAVSTLLFLLLQLFNPPIVNEMIESKTYDLRLRLRNALLRQPPSAGITVVEIDEKSIKEIGRWPWNRDVFAELLTKVSAQRPKVIGIDVMFIERETPERDKKLAEAITRAGNVVLATPFEVPEGEGTVNSPAPGEVPDSLWDSAFMEVRSQKGIKWKNFAVKATAVAPPLPELAAHAALGHVYSLPDMDGVQRWEILYLNYGDDCYPQFSLQIARIALGLPMKEMVLYGAAGIGLRDRFIPTDLHGRVGINYLGKEHSFPVVSAADLIKDRVAPDVLKNRIVLIGTSALGTYDQKVTPFSANMPGVEKNASVVENILKNNFIRKSPGVIELAAIILTGILLGLVLPRLKALWSSLLAAVFIGSYIAVCCYLLMYQNLWANLLYPVTNMFTIFTTLTAVRFFHEERKAREIRQMFSSYVSPKIVKELIDDPERAKLGGERRMVTVLFSDVIGFTSLSEKRQPEEVVSLLNEYFEEMADIIFKWDGTLDKFVGDEIMALWGAPVEQANHAELALRCAADMSVRLTRLQKTWEERGEHILEVGIGINSGEVLIGNIGAQGKKMDYTAIGDHVNLAARVEKLTRRYGVRILVTENTINSVSAAAGTAALPFEFREIESVKVKGKEKEIRVLELKVPG